MISYTKHIASLQNFIRPDITPAIAARVVCVCPWLDASAHHVAVEHCLAWPRLTPLAVAANHVAVLRNAAGRYIPPPRPARVVLARLLLLWLDASAVSRIRTRYYTGHSRSAPPVIPLRHVVSLQYFIRPNIPPTIAARVVCLLCLFVVHRCTSSFPIDCSCTVINRQPLHSPRLTPAFSAFTSERCDLCRLTKSTQRQLPIAGSNCNTIARSFTCLPPSKMSLVCCIADRKSHRLSTYIAP
jgi:hypothetical protein